ncbi:type IV pilus modification PilV family protein [Amphritea sp. HPY]|uniref:type IV pilus modification PilV family protein n=1 Tax=Amphritea sp. HPY TaxID=3421652 RepID=UPI003D7D00B2
MKIQTQQRGVALLEVVIALFVVGFGLVAVAMFSNGLFSESGQVKSKTEALQLAQQKIEELRDEADTGGLGSLNNDTDTLSGTNANYSLASSLTFVPNTVDPEYAKVQVVVSWDDKQGSQSVSLNSFVSAIDADALSGLIAGSLQGGGLAETPDGSAEYGSGEVIDTTGFDDVTATPAIAGGTKLYKDGDEYILTTHDSKELLTNRSGMFSRVLGRVYIDAAMSVSESDIEIVPSDTGVCRKTLIQVPDTSPAEYATELNEVHYIDGGLATNPETDGTLLYSYFSYTCYFGSGWYGNIGVLRSDNPNTNDRSCGGDPLKSDDGTDASRHPQLMATRTYRGFTPQVDSDDFDSDGDLEEPAIDANGNRIYLSSGMVASALYGDTSGASQDTFTHDFLLTNITGTVADSDCEPKLEGSDHESALAGASDQEFELNNGSFVCVLDDTGESNCPDVLPSGLGTQVTGTEYEVRGGMTMSEDSVLSAAEIAAMSLVTSQGVACDINYDDSDDSISWTCPVFLAGSQWSGNLKLSTEDTNEDPDITTEVNICSVDSFNLILDTAEAGTADVTGDPAYFDSSLAFAVEPPGTNCSGDGGTIQYYVVGTVENSNRTAAVDLSGAEVKAYTSGDSVSESATCRSSLGTLTGYRDGGHIAEYVCLVDSGFNGYITLDSVPNGVRVKNGYPDFSRSPVISDESGQTIQVQ